MSVKAVVKAHLVPSGPSPRTIRAGIASGLRMQIDLAHQTRQCLGIYELELDRHLRRILRPGVTSFDVGAQHGYDSLAMAKRTRAVVAAFECERECLVRMGQSFALNPELAPLIQPVSAFVGDRTGELRLDGWAYEGGFVPDFIKLDIEGGEVSALRSAQRILAERHPAVVVEVHSEALERESGRLLVEHGYRPIVVSQRKIFPDLRPLEHNRWLVADALASFS